MVARHDSTYRAANYSDSTMRVSPDQPASAGQPQQRTRAWTWCANGAPNRTAADVARSYVVGIESRSRQLRIMKELVDESIDVLASGMNIGAFGDLTTFSFHPNKNITSIEGGALVVNNDAEATRVEALRFHGITYLPDRTRDVAFPGGKFNLPDVNACIGLAQLERLPQFLARRRALVDRYFAKLATEPPCVLPPQPDAGGEDGHSWNMFCVLLPLNRLTISRKEFRDALEARGIATGVSYEALHLTTLGRRYGGREGQYPNAERISRETVTLPLHASMTEADVDRVCGAVAEVIAAGRK